MVSLDEINSQSEIKALLDSIMGLHVMRYVVVDFDACNPKDADGQS